MLFDVHIPIRSVKYIPGVVELDSRVFLVEENGWYYDEVFVSNPLVFSIMRSLTAAEK